MIHTHNAYAALAVVLYVVTLYPGIARVLLSRKYVWHAIGRNRREIGLASFFVACIHIVWVLVQTGYTGFVSIISGVTCFAIFLLLSVTSTRAAMKKLGKNWKRLHSLTYILPPLLIWHVVTKMGSFTGTFTRINILILSCAFSLLLVRYVRSLTEDTPRRSQRRPVGRSKA